ncbi:hypothetical protein [Streptomyces sp. NPDC000983]|uniref:hypothetical protein n=1 Tax=Streptomyces sp. NPDC000983 TaxID=3154373 RepID=UPI003328BC74
MPQRRLQRPRDDATASAMGRALHALTALLPALGEGTHELSLTAERTDGTEMNADLHVTNEQGTWHVNHTAEEYLQFFVLLTFTLETSTIHDAVLIATTDAGTTLHTRGWDVHKGWLHPMNTTELQDAVTYQPADNTTPYNSPNPHTTGEKAPEQTPTPHPPHAGPPPPTRPRRPHRDKGSYRTRGIERAQRHPAIQDHPARQPGWPRQHRALPPAAGVAVE